MERSLLVGVDGSPESRAAVRWAAEEAVRRGAKLWIGHVRTWLDDVHAAPEQPDGVRGLTARLLDEAADEAHRVSPGLTVRTELLVGGAPAEVLVRAAERAELLVLGSRGLGGFAGLVVGSVGLAVTARCERPTVLVRASAVRRSDAAQDDEVHWTGEIHRTGEVVVGVDSRDPSPETLAFAFRQAGSLGTGLRAVHGWEPPASWGYAGWVPPHETWEQFGTIEADLLEKAVADVRDRYPDVPVVLDARAGTAAGAVVEASHEAALVVVGRRRRPHPVGMRLGPAAHAVLHHAHAPVAVVPHD
ncbi:universal stress protein [Kitasatospora sp. NPDC051853]|uniref:universal stress protein n=1 Tax=Kitasatospora sp. NPDC051853 TaxID=3364058 RepID=UPI00379ED6AF